MTEIKHTPADTFRDVLWVTDLGDVSMFEYFDLPEGVEQYSYTKTEIATDLHRELKNLLQSLEDTGVEARQSAYDAVAKGDGLL